MGEGEVVLVVEDDSAVRLLIVDVLKELGYRTIEAEDGEHALSGSGKEAGPPCSVLNGLCSNSILTRGLSRTGHGHDDQAVFHGRSGANSSRNACKRLRRRRNSCRQSAPTSRQGVRPLTCRRRDVTTLLATENDRPPWDDPVRARSKHGNMEIMIARGVRQANQIRVKSGCYSNDKGAVSSLQ
jgi:hypothetical protein